MVEGLDDESNGRGVTVSDDVLLRGWYFNTGLSKEMFANAIPETGTPENSEVINEFDEAMVAAANSVLCLVQK